MELPPLKYLFHGNKDGRITYQRIIKTNNTIRESTTDWILFNKHLEEYNIWDTKASDHKILTVDISSDDLNHHIHGIKTAPLITPNRDETRALCNKVM